MSHVVHPHVFIIGETRTIPDNYRDFLREIGAEGWESPAASDGELMVETFGKLCYMSFDTSLNKNLTRTGTRDNFQYINQQILDTGHGSVLEHAHVNLVFTNVSRIFTHELVRHRAGLAFSQVSGRYVRVDDIGYWMPSCISNEPRAVEVFSRAFSAMEGWVAELGAIYNIDAQAFKMKKVLTSAFRRLVGNGQSNHIAVSANHRALRHMIALRTDPAAEEEIRVVFMGLFSQLKQRYPAIYGDAVAVYEDESDVIGHVEFQNRKV